MLRSARIPERALSAVPGGVAIALALALALQFAWHALAPPPAAQAGALPAPPEARWLQVGALGEPIALGHLLTLYLQAFDNQPGLSIPYADLDYGTVEAWLARSLELDPGSQYPLMMAVHLYGRVPDPARSRQMFEFVYREFLKQPDRRWRWLAHAALLAKHRLGDRALALRYAEAITQHAGGALNWARQMRIFILEDMGERQAAAVLLGGLLASGEVTDEAEIRFLTQRLESLRNVEKSSIPSESR